MKDYRPPRKKMLWPEPEPMDLWKKFKEAVFIIICLLALLSVWSWQMMRDAEDRAEHNSKIAVAMLNGNTLHDISTGDAYFFDKPVIIKVKQ